MHVRFRDSRTSLVSKVQLENQRGIVAGVPPIDRNNKRRSRLVLRIRFLHALRRFLGLRRRRFFRWFRLFSNSFGVYNVDEVIPEIARAVDLGDSRPEEFGVVKHPRQLVSVRDS